MSRGYFDAWAPYVPVAQRRIQAERKAAELKKKGQACAPVHIEGRLIARSFWGKAWCDNLEAYSDYANRLPRGRTYVRNGSVVDLQIDTGSVKALVSGSSLYRVEVSVQPLEAARWKAIVRACAGQVASLIEVLQGRISKAVMTVVTAPATGLFPSPRQMAFNCSCPDGARMCKHVAATLYGVGARLDDDPDLLFKLRHVTALDLIQQGAELPAAPVGGAASQGVLEGADLAALFGIEMGEGSAPAAAPVPRAPATPVARVAKAARPTPPDPKTKARAFSPAEAQLEPWPRPKPPAAGKPSTTLAAATLIARGIPRHMIQSWLVAGVLKRSPQRGIYKTTRQTEARIQAYLERGAGP